MKRFNRLSTHQIEPFIFYILCAPLQHGEQGNLHGDYGALLVDDEDAEGLG